VVGAAVVELVRVGSEIRQVTLVRGREGGLRVSLCRGTNGDRPLHWRLPKMAQAFAVEVTAAVATRYPADLARVFAPPRR
jgi:hypothetical protein